MLQKTIAQLIIRFARQGNMKAVRQLANQVKMPVQNALKSAYSTLRYHARNNAIDFAKKYNKPLPTGKKKQITGIWNTDTGEKRRKENMGYRTTITLPKSSQEPFTSLPAFIFVILMGILFLILSTVLYCLKQVVVSLTRPLVERLTGKSCPMVKK